MIETTEVKKFATFEELMTEVRDIRRRTDKVWLFLPNNVTAKLGKYDHHIHATPDYSMGIVEMLKYDGEQIKFNVRDPEEAYFFSLE